jgi:DNA-binding IclR family transcriptional regulator
MYDGRMGEPESGVRSIERALAMLRCFRDDGPALGSAEIARRLGLPTSTAHRIARELARDGFLEFDGRGYQLGPSVIELGLVAYRQRGLSRVAPELEHLQRVTSATADLAIRGGSHAVLVAGGSLRPELGVGLRRPLHSTALGKVLLAWERPGGGEVADLAPLPALTDRTIVEPDRLRAEIQRVRKDGYAMNDGESAVGIRSVAVPILDRTMRVRFALAVRATPEVLPEPRIPWVLGQARACAKALQILLLAPEERLPPPGPSTSAPPPPDPAPLLPTPDRHFCSPPPDPAPLLPAPGSAFLLPTPDPAFPIFLIDLGDKRGARVDEQVHRCRRGRRGRDHRGRTAASGARCGSRRAWRPA